MKNTRWSLPAAAFPAAIVLSALLLAGTPACREAGKGRPAGDPDRVVATWSGGEIRRRDLPEKLLERIDSETHAAPPDQRAAVAGKLLTRWARLEILYREALRDGLDRRPDALARLAAREAEFLAKSWIESHREPARVDPARIEAEVARRSALAGSETRRFSNIFLRVPKGDEEARAKARSRMEQIRRELEEGTAFEDLARTWSDSVTARSGGRVEWTTREPLDEKVAASVFSLKEGEVGAPVETRDGLHLFRVDEIRRPAAPDTAALRRRVEEEMTAEAVHAGDEAIRARAFDEAGVEIDVAGLARPAASAPPVVARWDGGKQTLTRADFEALRASPVNVAADSPEAFARRIVIDRILASRFSSALDEKLAREVSRVRRGELILVAREERIRKVPIEVRPEEEKAFYDENVSTTGWMLARTVDLLFFEQKGEAAAGVYAEGEAVTKDSVPGRASTPSSKPAGKSRGAS